MRTIALDVDSVLFPINELIVLPVLSGRLGRSVGKLEITSWSYGDIKDGKKTAYQVFRRPELYDLYNMEHLYGGAEEVLGALRTHHRVIALSSPFASHATSKWRFLQRLGFAHEDIVLCGDKTLVGFDLLLDDAPHTCAAVGADRAVVFDQPWNHVPELRYFHRANHWQDVPEIVARILR